MENGELFIEKAFVALRDRTVKEKISILNWFVVCPLDEVHLLKDILTKSELDPNLSNQFSSSIQKGIFDFQFC